MGKEAGDVNQFCATNLAGRSERVSGVKASGQNTVCLKDIAPCLFSLSPLPHKKIWSKSMSANSGMVQFTSACPSYKIEFPTRQYALTMTSLTNLGNYRVLVCSTCRCFQQICVSLTLLVSHALRGYRSRPLIFYPQ